MLPTFSYENTWLVVAGNTIYRSTRNTSREVPGFSQTVDEEECGFVVAEIALFGIMEVLIGSHFINGVISELLKFLYFELSSPNTWYIGEIPSISDASINRRLRLR
jgi:hypothetical protein